MQKRIYGGASGVLYDYTFPSLGITVTRFENSLWRARRRLSFGDFVLDLGRWSVLFWGW